jgi:Zn-dependent protease
MFLPDPSVLIARLVIIFIAFPVHELAHAWTAEFFGDSTPRSNGRLSFNPLVHIDPLGALLLLGVGFGWAKPVPINPYYLQRRSPSAVMWVSLAGPMSNFLLAALAAIPFRLGAISVFDVQMSFATQSFLPSLPQLLWIFISINLLLMLFNLIPIAPLDGEKIVSYFFPPSWARFMDTIRPYGPLILLAVIFLGVLGRIISPPMSVLMRFLVG